MKYLFYALLAFCGYYYVSHHFYEIRALHDSLTYAKKYPDPKLSPALDYYAGTIYYARAEYPQAQEAFTQLLTDYPTYQYMPKALERLEDAAENNKDWQAARAAADKYIEDYPNDHDIEVMKHRQELLNYHHGSSL